MYKNDTILEKYGGIFDFGFPYSTKRIDAALTFGRYKNTYFFVGDEYWRYNEKYKSMDAGYPKKISSVWKGVPSNVDAAITWKNGRTYFFKGMKFSYCPSPWLLLICCDLNFMQDRVCATFEFRFLFQKKAL